MLVPYRGTWEVKHSWNIGLQKGKGEIGVWNDKQRLELGFVSGAEVCEFYPRVNEEILRRGDLMRFGI